MNTDAQPVAMMSEYVVKRCARSAKLRPVVTILSNRDCWPWRARWARARSRATFSCGVSFAGAGVLKSIVEKRVDAAADEDDCLDEAYGPVDVKSVASRAERAIA